MRMHWLMALVLAALVFGVDAHAGGGPFGIDHQGAYDDTGIWARRNQNILINGMIAAEVVEAVWEGGESRFGVTLWRSIDATVAGAVSAGILKKAFSRERPNDTSDPNQWFKGGGNSSFPSGEVTVTSAIVTPLVLEYGKEQPWMYALELLPIYDGIARMKVRGHWASDVIAGFALGSAAGYFLHSREKTPFTLSVMPNAVYVGFKKRF